MVKKYLPITLFLFLFLVVGNAWGQYTVGDSISLIVGITLDGVDHNWDSVRATIYRLDDPIDSLLLAIVDTGIFYGVYPPLSDVGSYWIRYKAWYVDEPTSWTYRFSVNDPADFKYSGATCNAPTGTNQIDVTVKKSTDSTAIDVCLVAIYNYDESALLWWDYTDALGQISFMYDNDSLMIKLSRPLYSFTIPETLWIDGAEDVTYYGSAPSIGSPPAANLCRCYGWVKQFTAIADTTYIIEIINSTIPLRYEGIIVSPFKVWDNPKDTTGYFYFDIYKTSTLEPDTSNYTLIIRDTDGNNMLKEATGETGIQFQAPDSSSYWITW